METLRFDIQGMTCGGCVGSVQRAIGRIDGVAKVDVSLQPGSATVQADPAKVTTAAIQAALAKIGFEARPAQAG